MFTCSFFLHFSNTHTSTESILSSDDPNLNLRGTQLLVSSTKGWAPFLANPESNATADNDNALYGGDWDLMLFLKEALNFEPV